jgi:hypothetical protein
MTWFWLNIPLAVVFLLAWTLIPAWIVIRHPDTAPRAAHPDRPAAGRVTAAAAPAQLPTPPGPAERQLAPHA